MQDRRKALLPYKKHKQKKLAADRKVFIAYPATLNYSDEEGRQKTVGVEDLKKLKGEMTKYTEQGEGVFMLFDIIPNYS